jgi:hypothetical protein
MASNTLEFFDFVYGGAANGQKCWWMTVYQRCMGGWLSSNPKILTTFGRDCSRKRTPSKLKSKSNWPVARLR